MRTKLHSGARSLQRLARERAERAPRQSAAGRARASRRREASTDVASSPGGIASGRLTTRAKLALLESLLASERPRSAARAVVDWLVQALGVRPVAVLVAGAGKTAGVFVCAAAVGTRASSFGSRLVVGPVVSEETIEAVGREAFGGGRFGTHMVQGERGLLGFVLHASTRRPSQLRWGLAAFSRRLRDLDAARWASGRVAPPSRPDDPCAARHVDGLVDSIADPVVVTGAAGELVFSNAAAKRLFTGEVGSIQEQRARDNVARIETHAAGVRASKSAGPLRGDLVLTDPRKGGALPIEAVSVRTTSAGGAARVVVTVLHDRSEAVERARLYEDLKRASELLEQKVRAATWELVRRNELLRRQAVALEAASAAKSQFLANVSHEFRTPLNAILGYTSMLLQGVSGALDANVERHLQRVHSNAKNLLNIINDILDISKIEAGKLPLRYESVSPSEVVREVVAELEPLLPAPRVALRVRLRARLRSVRTDRGKVKQILMNLVSNAFKFTSSGSVTVSARARAGAIVITVADTGIGIPERDLEAVFRDFHQVDDSPTRAYGGTGLGLAISRRLARLLGGEITLESEVGVGSTFRLLLPAKEGAK